MKVFILTLAYLHWDTYLRLHTCTGILTLAYLHLDAFTLTLGYLHLHTLPYKLSLGYFCAIVSIVSIDECKCSSVRVEV